MAAIADRAKRRWKFGWCFLRERHAAENCRVSPVILQGKLLFRFVKSDTLRVDLTFGSDAGLKPCQKKPTNKSHPLEIAYSDWAILS